MFMRGRRFGTRAVARTAGGGEVEPFHVMGEINIGFHKLPPRGYAFLGMFLLLGGIGKPLPDSQGKAQRAIGNVRFTGSNTTFVLADPIPLAAMGDGYDPSLQQPNILGMALVGVLLLIWRAVS